MTSRPAVYCYSCIKKDQGSCSAISHVIPKGAEQPLWQLSQPKAARFYPLVLVPTEAQGPEAIYFSRRVSPEKLGLPEQLLTSDPHL